MNTYQRMWDVLGYGERFKRIHACHASEARKAAACNRVWNRMVGGLK